MKRQPPVRKTAKTATKKPDSIRQTKQRTSGAPSAKQIAVELIIIFAVIILGVSTFLWWHYVESNPKRVFTAMLNNALQVQSGTIKIVQPPVSGQTLDQTVQFSVTGQHLVYAYKTLSQLGSTVHLETIGTPSDEFDRYTNIQTSQLSASGKPLNFNNILGQWAENGSPTSQIYNNFYFSLTALDVVPFGNFSYAQRAKLLKLMQSSYSVDYSDNGLGRQIINGRPTYSYNVQVVPKEYVTMLKQYATLTGINQLESIKPSDYSNKTSLTVRLVVDVWSRQLISIAYPSNGNVKYFSQFGQQRTPIPFPPTPRISITELERRLNSIQ